MTTHHINVENLLANVDLPNLVEQAGAQLHTTGRDQRCACPLHKGNDKTAFQISTGDNGRQYWHCYTGCGAGGDAIDFVKRWKGFSFREAVLYLAEMVHVDPQSLNFSELDIEAETSLRQKHELFSAAAQYFTEHLWSDQGVMAREYLQKRGFSLETIRLANLGFTSSDNGLQQHLKNLHTDLSLAHQIGLLRTDGLDFTANAEGKAASPNGYIVFAHMLNGRVLYFSARACTPDSQMPDPKDKSRNMPGERQPYWALVPTDPEIIIVEGQSDAESLRQLGRSALALCGVGEHLPESDLLRLKKRNKIYLSLDNDTLRADLNDDERQRRSEKAQVLCETLCSTFGPLTLIVPDLLHKDFNAWLQADLSQSKLLLHIKPSKSWIDTLLGYAKDASPHQLDRLAHLLMPLLHQLPETLRPRYNRQVERSLGMNKRDLVRLSGEMSTTDNAIYSEVKNDSLHYMGEPLGNFWARIFNELMVDDGLNPLTVRYGIEGKLSTGQPLQPIQVDARSFGKMEWVPDNWGMRPIFNLPPSKVYLFARAIQEISMGTVCRERLYVYTGWTEADGQRGFLSASGLIHATGLDENIRVDLGANNMRHYALPSSVTDETVAVRASLDFLTLGPRKVTSPIWAAMYAAPLTSLRALNAVMSIYGTTQSGKTTISLLALAHYGSGFIQGRDYHAPIDWTSTITAIEAAMSQAKDVPLVIDDFAPQFSTVGDANSLRKKAHQVVRSVGNRSARGRSRADLSQQITRVPRGLVMMTAENPLVGQSIVGRMIYVFVEPGDILPTPGTQVLDSRLTCLQEKAQKGLLAQAMSLYIQYLAKNWERIAETFPAMVDAASQTAREAGGLQNRLPDAYGVLAAGQELALRCFQELGFISLGETETLIQENNAALLEVIHFQAEQVAAESPVRKLFEALSALLEQRKIYFESRVKGSVSSQPGNADLVGYFDPDDDKVVYLRTAACLAAAKEYWRKLDENLDIMPDALRKQLNQMPGMLNKVDKNQVEVSVQCSGVKQRVLAVNAKQVELIYDLSLVNSK